MTPKVQAFAKQFYEALETDAWGCIEPEVFRNIAEGIETPDAEDGYWANKMDQDEMAEAVQGMIAILEKVL